MLTQETAGISRWRYAEDLAYTEVATRPEFLRSLLAHMRDGLSVADLDDRRVMVNRALCDLTGFTAAELMSTEDPCPCWPADKAAELNAALQRIKRGDTTPFECEFQHKNGGRFPVLLRPAFVRDSDGQPVAWFYTVTDLTERRRAEAARAASEQRWRAIASNPFDFVAIVDREYVHRYMNHVEPELQMSEVIGITTPFDFVAPEFHADMLRAYDFCFRTGRAASYEAYSPELDRWYATVVGAIQGDGEINELALLSRDVSEAKAVQRARASSERRLALALASVCDGVVELDLRTHRYSYSARTYELFGYAEGDPALSQLEDGLTSRLHPDERSAISSLLVAAGEDGTPFSHECRLRVRDGSYRWFQVRGRALREDERLVAFITDINERHEAEEQRRALMSELQQAQRLETVGTLAGGIAHDFNNLLVPITAALELAQPALPPDHSARAVLHDALEAALRARQLTQQILSFARRDATTFEPIDLVTLVQDEVRLWSGPAQPPIETSFALDRAIVMGERSQLQQVVANLLRNAQQAMSGVCGRLRVLVERVHLEPGARVPPIEPGDWLRLTVSDQGVGMSSAVQRRAFEPFFTTKPPGRGTGLGLAVVHGIIQRHSGHLRLDSEIGRGTTFEVYLPAVPAATAVVRQEAEVRAAEVEAHVVCVDDESVVLSVTKRALELAGFRVRATTRAVEALQWLEASCSGELPAIDVLITDFRMPGLSGLELAQRARELAPDLPVILVTGFAEGLPQSGNPPGVSACLQKPFRISELTQCVMRCLAAKRGHAMPANPR
jgi:PAS domain S-box-containing protein